MALLCYINPVPILLLFIILPYSGKSKLALTTLWLYFSIFCIYLSQGVLLVVVEGFLSVLHAQLHSKGILSAWLYACPLHLNHSLRSPLPLVLDCVFPWDTCEVWRSNLHSYNLIVLCALSLNMQSFQVVVPHLSYFILLLH